jgi:hypothetical protein
VGTDPWMTQVRTQGTAEDGYCQKASRDASGIFSGVNSVSLVSSTVQPFRDIIDNLITSHSIPFGHPSSEFCFFRGFFFSWIHSRSGR